MYVFETFEHWGLYTVHLTDNTVIEGFYAGVVSNMFTFVELAEGKRVYVPMQSIKYVECDDPGPSDDEADDDDDHEIEVHVHIIPEDEES